MTSADIDKLPWFRNPRFLLTLLAFCVGTVANIAWLSFYGGQQFESAKQQIYSLSQQVTTLQTRAAMLDDAKGDIRALKESASRIDASLHDWSAANSGLLERMASQERGLVDLASTVQQLEVKITQISQQRTLQP